MTEFKWKKLMHRALVRVFAPIESFGYIELYLRWWTALAVECNPRKRILFFLLLTIFSLQMCKLLWLYCNSFSASQVITELVLYDEFHKMPVSKLMQISFDPMLIVEYWLLYLHGEPASARLLTDVLLVGRSDYFITDKCPKKDGKTENVYQAVQSFGLLLLNTLARPFIFFTFWGMFHRYLRMSWSVFQERVFFFSSLTGVACYVFHLVNALINWAVLLALVHIWIVQLFNGLVLLRLLNIKLDQILAIFTTGNIWANFTRKLTTFQCHFTRTLVLVARSDWLYGKMFLLFLVFNCPLTIAVSLDSSKMPFTEEILGWAFLGCQILGLFGMHFVISKSNRNLNRFGKVLMKLPPKLDVAIKPVMQHGKRKGKGSVIRKPLKVNILVRLRLTSLATIFHTERPYGITYGSIALVTINTFAKFSILYFKALMISHKMANAY